MSILNSILGLLPGDGWKTVIGFIVTVVSAKFPNLFPSDTAAQIVNLAGTIYGSIGAAHKVVKANL